MSDVDVSNVKDRDMDIAIYGCPEGDFFANGEGTCPNHGAVLEPIAADPGGRETNKKFRCPAPTCQYADDHFGICPVHGTTLET